MGYLQLAILKFSKKIQRIEKAVLEQSDRKVVLSQQEKGWVIWSPLPVELSEGFEPTVALYRFALAKAGIQRLFAVEKEDSSVLIMPTIFSEAVLYSLISESDQDTDVLLKPLSTGNQIHVHVPAQRTELIFVHRKDGTLISQLNQD